MAPIHPNLASAYEATLEKLQGYIDFSRQQTIVWGWVYYGTRILLIVLAGAAAYAAKYNGLGNTTAILSAIVSIGTGIETALKPGDKHKTHFVYNDLYSSLRLKALAVDSTNSAEVRALQAELAQVDEKYQREQF
jgi:hypothetical protein